MAPRKNAKKSTEIPVPSSDEIELPVAPAPPKRIMKKKAAIKEEPVPIEQPVEPVVAPKKIMKKKTVVKEEPVPIEPVVEPPAPPKKIMKKKTVVKEEPVPIEQPVVPVVAPKKIMKKKTVVKEESSQPSDKPSKKVKNPPAEPMVQIIDQTPIDADEEIVIVLSKIEIGTKKFLYNSSNDKLYDLKYKYVGRRKGCEVDTSFPDSDGE
jgi:hypothetical protein